MMLLLLESEIMFWHDFGTELHIFGGISQAGAPFGVCKNIPVSNGTSPTYAAGSFSGSVELTCFNSSCHKFLHFLLFIFHVNVVSTMTKSDVSKLDGDQ